jgi:hypothetical protein
MDTKYQLDGLTKDQIAAMSSGAADASTFYCSGFSVWTLAAAGYDVAEPIKGTDGVPYSYTDDNAKDKPGTSITMRMLLNGEGAAVTAMASAKAKNMTNGGWVMFVDNDRAGFETGLTASGAEAAAKGAAGAFELAHIGAEVPEAAQKPGDFAQSRYTNPKEIHGVPQAEQAIQQGAGHAWQVWSVTAKGSAMFGLDRSPRPTSGTLTGWHDGVEFTIDKDTDPALVGEHVVEKASRIEANIAGARSGSQKQSDANGKGDTGGDGGVGISKDMAVPDADGPSHYYHYVVFYGRLTDNPWTHWKPAKAP